MKLILVFLLAHTLYSQEFVIASMEGINFEKLQSSTSESQTTEITSSDSESFDNALLEAKSSNSQESVKQMLGMTSTAGENLPKLWVEIALKKIKLIDKSKPLHLRLKVFNESMKYLEKASKADSETFSKSKKWINYAKKITQNQSRKLGIQNKLTKP